MPFSNKKEDRCWKNDKFTVAGLGEGKERLPAYPWGAHIVISSWKKGVTNWQVVLLNPIKGYTALSGHKNMEEKVAL